MDNLTHSLVAVALSRAGLRRVTPQATILLLISANLPDLDVLSLAGGQLADFEIHRGYTHSLIALPVLALISMLLTRLIVMAPIRWIPSFFTALAGLASHLLLDWTSSFGIRPFLPFSSRWFYLDLNGFYDGVILAMLLLAFLWPRFVRLIWSEIGRNTRHAGQGSAILILLLLLAYEGGRWSLHQRALNELSSRLYDGEVPVEVSALAEPNNPLEWIGVIETDDSFRLVKTGSLELIPATDARIFRKLPPSRVWHAVQDYEPFRYMVYFSRFPVWAIEPVKLDFGVGEKVDLTDLRFGTPGAGDFHASALADRNGRILVTQFGFSTRELNALP